MQVCDPIDPEFPCVTRVLVRSSMLKYQTEDKL
jgi:hypothetical protein